MNATTSIVINVAFITRRLPYANDLQKFITISRGCRTGDVFLMSGAASPFFPTGRKSRETFLSARSYSLSRNF